MSDGTERPLRIAGRMDGIESSGIRKMFERVSTLDDPVNLSIGQAHFEVPPAVRNAAVEAVGAGHNRYTPTQGIPQLLEAVLDRQEARLGTRPESALVTSGVSAGLLLSYSVTLDPGDEILLPDPYFKMYLIQAQMLGAVPRFYETGPDWAIDPDRIEAQITDRTRVLLVNSPQNPTGRVYSEDEVKALADIAERHGLIVLADEIYEDFVFDGTLPSVARHTDRCLTLSGFSKTFGAAGWRVGWITGPAALTDPMLTLQQFTFVCAPTPFQHAAVAGLTDVEEAARARARCAEYAAKRDRIFSGLGEVFPMREPEGSFYAFPRLPEGWTGADFAQACLDENTLVVPGSAFSAHDTHFRLSYAAPDRELDRGIEVLRGVADTRS